MLELDRPLTSTYWMNIADPALPFTAVIEHTNFVSPEHYEAVDITSISASIWKPTIPISQRTVTSSSTSTAHFDPPNPQFERSRISNWWVFRERAAQPIITTNYSKRLPSHRTPLENLYLANTSQIYPEDRGTNYSVRLGNRIATMVLDDDKSGAPWASDD